MKVKINRIYFEEVNNIERIKITKCGTLVERKIGWPKYYIADCSKTELLVRMVNVGVTSEKIKELRDK